MIQRGDPYLIFWEFQKKKNPNYQNIILIFNSIFYKESKEFTFAPISRKKLLFDPSVWMEDDTKDGPPLLFWEFQEKKKS